MNRSGAYEQDLAYIHDAGFGDFARNAAPGLLRILRANGVRRGLVVDLGCGSGILAREFIDAGYDVLGVDISPAMIALARRKAPRARFMVASLSSFELPACDAIVSTGECLNYTFDGPRTRQSISALFHRVHAALRPGGMFVFDIAGPARAPESKTRRVWSAGKDWAILAETRTGRSRRSLAREIICFRRVGRAWRRSTEAHVQRLFWRDEIAGLLAKSGFEIRISDRYGREKLPRGLAVFIARKPA
jgi:SAM-dependent methyltransferase